ncbi:MAG: hypothetical protein HY863_06580 [Chloroflexi bacterium]|nr:hypothetical protein [Chloroflexota bacterium]
MTKNALSITEGSQSTWSQANETANDKPVDIGLIKQSALFGGILGEIAGAILGTVTGALTANLTGILMGFTAGIMLGSLTGLLIGIVVGRIAGDSGGPSIGAFSGMGFGAILGALFGLIIPESLRMSAGTMNTPVLNALTSSRFETVSLFAFLLCILGTLVGVWVSGKNYKP